MKADPVNTFSVSSITGECQIKNITMKPVHKRHSVTTATCLVFQLFEDMKAYRGIDDRIRLFRPDRHIHRMLRSIRRAALPVSLPNLQSRQNRSGRISLGRQNWSGLDKTSPAGRTSVGLPKPVRPD